MPTAVKEARQGKHGVFVNRQVYQPTGVVTLKVNPGKWWLAVPLFEVDFSFDPCLRYDPRPVLQGLANVRENRSLGSS